MHVKRVSFFDELLTVQCHCSVEIVFEKKTCIKYIVNER